MISHYLPTGNRRRFGCQRFRDVRDLSGVGSVPAVPDRAPVRLHKQHQVLGRRPSRGTSHPAEGSGQGQSRTEVGRQGTGCPSPGEDIFHFNIHIVLNCCGLYQYDCQTSWSSIHDTAKNEIIYFANRPANSHIGRIQTFAVTYNMRSKKSTREVLFWCFKIISSYTYKKTTFYIN